MTSNAGRLLDKLVGVEERKVPDSLGKKPSQSRTTITSMYNSTLVARQKVKLHPEKQESIL